jgi:DNA-binding CsgD family transcriptional regulator
VLGDSLGGQSCPTGHRKGRRAVAAGQCTCNVRAGQMATDSFMGHAGELRGRPSECEVLRGVLAAVARGESRAIVLRGEPGVGKTALLEYLGDQASGCRVARAAGVQSEMELAFAALHQLLGPMLDRLGHLPAPQCQALQIAFGISAGPAPDRFLVALAVLNLLSDAAEERPLICLVDDEQWLDRASTQALAFVARRLDTESVGLVFAARVPGEDLAGLPELLVEGLRDADARALLDSALTGPLDERVRERIVAETHGNPLALLELPRGMTPAELAGGFGLPSAASLSGRIEESFRRQLDELPGDTQHLLQLAAADPVGDPLLVWRAGERLGIGTSAATPAVEAGLLEIGARVRFRHPLIRSAAYRSASVEGRQELHGALAEATDPEVDPDRRAWHRAQAVSQSDEDVAVELERSASRAQARGGLAAAAAFLERSAMLTPEPARRAQRLLGAAAAKRDVGALDAALGLLVAVEAGPADALRTGELEHLRGQIAFDQRRFSDAVRLLLSAAGRLEALNADSAREAHLEALLTTMWGGGLDIHGGVRRVAEAARAAPPGPTTPRAADLLLDAVALLFTDGYAAAAPALARALERLLALDAGADEAGGRLWLLSARAGGLVALELWDFDSWHALAVGQLQFARDVGALVQWQFAHLLLVVTYIFEGELSAAARLREEERAIAEATGNAPDVYTAIMFAAWRGREAEMSELIEAASRATTAEGLGIVPAYARSVLCNGVGRHDTARDCAREAFERDPVGYGGFVVAELAEAASRTGDTELLEAALTWLSERTGVVPAEWALGIEARVRALLSEGDAAEALYLESIEHLGRTRVRVELARSRLLYGEWLRRENRRVDAREQLRTAHEMLTAMGVDAFADRARREMLATCETVRKRTVEERDELTPQETQIARLARQGLSNPEIGTRLFISPRTVKYHLRKVFIKLNITSRSQLDRVLPSDSVTAGPP